VSTDWKELLLAYLHDPPDKALSVRGHVPRARDNAQIAVGDGVSRKVLEEAVSSADPLASIVERLPMPSAGDQGERAVGPTGQTLRIIHPLSACSKEWSVPSLDDGLLQQEQAQLRTIVESLPGQDEELFRNRFLAIWRLWPDALADHVDACFRVLPADTRTPDHTIWHHLDVVAAFQAALSFDGEAALLTFALGPVQRFLEAARTVRDLWSGSMILSWLAFQAMRPILEQFGPTALIYPALRGNPLLDLWLHQRLGQKLPLPAVDVRKTPALPHRFLAVVPWGASGEKASALAEQCRQAAQEAVQQLANAVHHVLRPHLGLICQDWDKHWGQQVGHYFTFAAAVILLDRSSKKVHDRLARLKEVDGRLARLLAGCESFAEAFPNAEAVRNLARAIPDDQQPFRDSSTGQVQYQDHAGRWQYQVELVQRSLAAHRSIRFVPTNPKGHPTQRFPQKCSLLGTFEQMGPDDFAASRQFWDRAAQSISVGGVRLRRGEAHCAIALMKRFAAPAFFRKELFLEPRDLRFPDTWTVAAADWLHWASIEWRQEWGVPWNGHWLHWSRPDEDPEEADPCPEELWRRIVWAREPKQLGKPPVYYAVLKLDGDDLGGWLRGENSPKVREVMHPDLVRYYEALGEQAQAGLDARRPVGPALHAALSTALAHFALQVVPEVVAKYHGTVIYSGGDDSLILLPTSTALACARELQRAYTSDWYPEGQPRYLLMGRRATISGGLVVAHAVDDLRLVLQDARRAEEKAKEAGRNALAITIRRRSGEHTSAVCSWDFVDTIIQWVKAFQDGASDRWAYHLYAERETLAALPRAAIQAEIRRQVSRADDPTPRLLPPDRLAEALGQFCDSTVTMDGQSRRRFVSDGEALLHFLTLCQSASFLVRGRDQDR
jgi:CRISPR-associated protein Cmr2